NERKSNVKLDCIRKIEKNHQKLWQEKKYFEIDALENFNENSKSQKYFVTFPYPYMNGRLHLGHAFSLSKCEFSVGYQRLRGKRCLFPFGLHCTGMPIRATADKLRHELESFGFPPKFPDNRVKTVYQWDIMKQMGLEDKEIQNFTDPFYWLEYFPPLAISDLHKIGAKIDTRRSFITTDANPYYDSFVRWQFWHLKNRNRLIFGKRHTIFSIKDKQPCMDHDRKSGEGVAPQEYTAIKHRVVTDNHNIFNEFKDKFEIFLLASTLRPETLYGQTNVFIHPDHEYIVFQSSFPSHLFVASESAVKNMAYQGITINACSYDIMMRFAGHELIGSIVTSPLSPYKSVYVYPMMSILPNKGTGIVVGVPSDSPDDLMALNDLKNKPALRNKYKLTDEMVIPYAELPIIDVPPYGTLSASAICNELKITSQNDSNLLKEAKEKLYKSSFYCGTMIVGEYNGVLINLVKNKIRDQLINKEIAFIYMEPESTVVSRSGDACIVALCDQWYLSYNDETWKNDVRTALQNINTYSQDVRHNFLATVDWLHEHACSRLYGLGTKVPWDQKYLIESLSDSTIYMAYYTVAHILQGGSLDGSTNFGNIHPDKLTPEIWDYIFFANAPIPISKDIDIRILNNMRREFQYWYPVDLRVSGKDLIPNHLTYCIYNHVAIWPDQPDLWPKSFRANGYLMLNSEKMSKSTGNFLTISETVEKYGADATRIGLADSGDAIDDANFLEKTTDAAVLRLYNLIIWSREMISSDNLRTGPQDSFCDRVFLNEINRSIHLTQISYDNMLFREAIKNGFFDLQLSRDWYKEISLQSMHRDVILRYIEIQCILLAPICPHICDYLYQLIKNQSIMLASWPEDITHDTQLHECSQYLFDSISSFRNRLKTLKDSNAKKKKTILPKSASIYVAIDYAPWQRDILSMLKNMIENNSLPSNNKEILTTMKLIPSVSTQKLQRIMTFMNYYKEKFVSIHPDTIDLNQRINELEILSQNLPYIKKTLEIDDITIQPFETQSNTTEEALPYRPIIIYN
ncbi:hypothetical protein HZS_6729, partial [Henneguya salminicola]